MFQKIITFSCDSYKNNCKAAERLNSEVKIKVFYL